MLLMRFELVYEYKSCALSLSYTFTVLSSRERQMIFSPVWSYTALEPTLSINVVTVPVSMVVSGVETLKVKKEPYGRFPLTILDVLTYSV